MSATTERPLRRGPARSPLAALALFAVLTTGCHYEPLGTSLDIAGGGLAGIDLRGDSLVVLGSFIRMEATGSVGGLLGMFYYDPLADAHWSTQDASIATVTPNPVDGDKTRPAQATVGGVGLGTTYITVSTRGFSATQRVRVVEIRP